MENLNAEQAINELETQTKYAKFIGSKGVLLSAKCAQFALDNIKYYEQRIKELTEELEKEQTWADSMIDNLRDDIRELTEENARLEKLCALRDQDNKDTQDLLYKAEAENDRLMRDKTALECIVETARNQAKADTVRKMQEEIEARCIKGGIYPAFVKSTIDQIAKEMIGVGK